MVERAYRGYVPKRGRNCDVLVTVDGTEVSSLI